MLVKKILTSLPLLLLMGTNCQAASFLSELTQRTSMPLRRVVPLQVSHMAHSFFKSTTRTFSTTGDDLATKFTKTSLNQSIQTIKTNCLTKIGPYDSGLQKIGARLTDLAAAVSSDKEEDLETIKYDTAVRRFYDIRSAWYDRLAELQYEGREDILALDDVKNLTNFVKQFETQFLA